MKSLRWLTALLLLLNFSANAGEIVLSGVYQGKNIFVQNPLNAENKTYCTEEVWVNDSKKMTQIRSSAYEIDLSFLGRSDSVTIRIVYRDDCMPKVLNAYVLRPSSGFQLVSFEAKGENLVWSVSGETQLHTYTVQQLVNNIWMDVQVVKSAGDGANLYTMAVPNAARASTYRVKALDGKTHQLIYSGELNYLPTQQLITFYPKSVSSKITLSDVAIYEVRSSDGKVLKKGRGSEITLSELKSGVYYLNINNSQTEKFFKK
jgi:hypothetical protein